MAATEGKAAFKLWLSHLEINYDELDSDKRVSYRALYDQAHPPPLREMEKIRYGDHLKVAVTTWDTAVKRSVLVDDIRQSTLVGFSRNIRHAFERDDLPYRKFAVYRVDLQELDMVNNTGRKHLANDEELRECLQEIYDCIYELPPSLFVWIEPSPNEHISPEKPPEGAGKVGGKPYPLADDTSEASSCSRYTETSNVCKLRDDNSCRFCGYYKLDNTGLEACHLYELESHGHVAKEHRQQALKEVGLLSSNDIVNLVTLCQACHFFFDKRGGYNLGVSPVSRKLLVGKAIRNKETMQGTTYEALHGKPVTFLGEPHQQPPQKLLVHRIKYFEDAQVDTVVLTPSKGRGKRKKPAVTEQRRMYYCEGCTFIAYRSEDLTAHEPACSATAEGVVQLLGGLAIGSSEK